MGGERELQIPPRHAGTGRLPPDFLSDFVVSVRIMRLSLVKAAYVAVDECRVVGNPEFARDDKVEVAYPFSICEWSSKFSVRFSIRRYCFAS